MVGAIGKTGRAVSSVWAVIAIRFGRSSSDSFADGLGPGCLAARDDGFLKDGMRSAPVL
jgi:hypothetical protein